jgi:hypothetical protein
LIKLLKYKDIDKKKWDDTIGKSFNGNIYVYSWFLDIVHPYWDALIEGDYERVMPLPVSKKWGIKYMLQPFFTQQLGVFSKSILTPEIVAEFIGSIPEDIKLIDINLNSFNRLTGNENLRQHKNYMLDLINVYDVIRRHYSTNLKRNLKKADKKKLSVIKNIKPEDIVQLFRSNRGKKVKHWTDHHYLRLQHLMYMSIHKGKGITYGVYSNENTLLAGACFLKSNSKLVFLFSGQSDEGKSNAALSYLIDDVIKSYSPSNYILDFEGSDDKGLARYYKSFGAKETIYFSYKKNELPYGVKMLYNTVKSFKNIF